MAVRYCAFVLQFGSPVSISLMFLQLEYNFPDFPELEVKTRRELLAFILFKQPLLRNCL
jgi:hypothetical protein